MIDWAASVIGPCMAVFGESQKPVYTRASGVGGPFEIEGVFVDAYSGVVVNVADGVPEIATVEPTLGVSLGQFGAAPPVQGDRVTIPRNGKTYVVASAEPDAKGLMILRLNLVAP